MKKCTMKITEATYNEAMANDGRIPANKQIQVFGECLVYGYGIYGTKVRIDEKDGFVVDYNRGDTCD